MGTATTPTPDSDRIGFVKGAQRFGMRLDEIREVLALRECCEQPCIYVRVDLRRQVTDIDGASSERCQRSDVRAWAGEAPTN